VLTETSLLPAIWHSLMGRDVCLLAVHAHMERNLGRMNQVAQWMRRKGLLTRARDRFDCVERIFGMPAYCGTTDIFMTIEPWLNAYHGFEALDQSGTPYAGAIKECAWLNTNRICDLVHALDDLGREGSLDGADFIGITREMVEVLVAYNGENTAAIPGRSWPFVRRMINRFALASLMIYSVLWAVARIRLGPIGGKAYLLGSTLALDMRLFKNLSDIADDRSQICIVYVLRSEAERAMRELDTEGIQFLSVQEGRMGPRQALAWLAGTLSDYRRVARHIIHHRPALFLQAAKLPHYRLIYRSLFNRYQFSYYWGRDDHDQTHHIRSQELRRVGGVSLGINHGYPSSDIVAPGMRYIDFDHYYVFGRGMFERYYRQTWPTHMTVTAIGTFGLSREELHRIAAPRTKDILYFLNTTLINDHVVDTALALAREFPDRRIFFKSKSSPYDRCWIDILETRKPLPSNFKFITANITVTYELLMWCGYSISILSSVGAESVHLGLRSFVLDTQPPYYPLSYRDFDRITFRQADQVIERIRDLEAGRDQYPWAAYDDLADGSGQDPFDRVRADMGLPPKSPGGMIEALRRTRETPIDLTDTV
jgi:hypothetical protein